MDFADNRIPVEALVFRCPTGEARDSCPVGFLRELPVLEALVLVSEMAQIERDKVLAHHEDCFSERATLESG